MLITEGIIKVARTIADLDGHEQIEKKHLSEALGYRAMDRLLKQLSWRKLFSANKKPAGMQALIG
ncbi:hypothetical protein OK016_09010 [Vibrio chagasii]|nr:hypothetical protein [Vibrio chagasii]